MTAVTTTVDHGTIRVERHGAIAHVLLDHPSRRNALTADMLVALERRLDALRDDTAVRVVVLRGVGDVFSAGVDLHDVLAVLDDDGAPTGGALTRVAACIRRLPALTVAALSGPCMGGAWMLAAACDLRLADASMRIGLTPVKLGIVFPYAGIVRLVELVGESTAADLLLTGRTVGADEAGRMRLVRRIEDDETLDAAVEHACDAALRLAPASVRATKRVLAAVARHDKGEVRDEGEVREHFLAPVLAGDASEGVSAFLQKRSPDFPSARG